MKKSILTVIALIAAVTMAGADALTVVKNPNPGTVAGKARDAAVVAAERKQAQDGVHAISAMAKSDGIAKVIAEINKGRAGAFAKYMPTGHFYLSLCEFKSDTSAVFVAHGTNPAFVGFEVPSLDIFKDNTGWNYADALFGKAGGRRALEGVMEGVVWTDPDWQKGKVCRMAAYNQVFQAGEKFYWTYFAVWLDQ